MPLDVLGCTRATLMRSTSLRPWPIGLGNLLGGWAGEPGKRLFVFFKFHFPGTARQSEPYARGARLSKFIFREQPGNLSRMLGEPGFPNKIRIGIAPQPGRCLHPSPLIQREPCCGGRVSVGLGVVAGCLESKGAWSQTLRRPMEPSGKFMGTRPARGLRLPPSRAIMRVPLRERTFTTRGVARISGGGVTDVLVCGAIWGVRGSSRGEFWGTKFTSAPG